MRKWNKYCNGGSGIFGVVLLAIVICPPRRVTSCFATHRPMPVPRMPLVVKNGSKTRGRFSWSIPLPVSRIDDLDAFLGRRRHRFRS